jgi:hypothetical protein
MPDVYNLSKVWGSCNSVNTADGPGELVQSFDEGMCWNVRWTRTGVWQAFEDRKGRLHVHTHRQTDTHAQTHTGICTTHLTQLAHCAVVCARVCNVSRIQALFPTHTPHFLSLSVSPLSLSLSTHTHTLRRKTWQLLYRGIQTISSSSWSQ